MGIEIEPYAYFGVNEHDYGTVTIRLIAYKARFVSGEELGEYTVAPADVRFVGK